MGRRTPTFRRVREHDPLRKSQINVCYDALEGLQRARPGPGLVGSFSGSHGAAYSPRRRPEWSAVITAAGTSTQAGSYAWTEVVASETTPGAWVPTGFSGALGQDAAWEYNLNATVPVGTYIWIWREETTGEPRFLMGTC